eukprot:8951681-Pyramimonas_sp.AAC.1
MGIIALLPKAADAERPVCECPSLHRIYCRARGRGIDEWSRERENFWGTAVRGSSALQAALLREI